MKQLILAACVFFVLRAEAADPVKIDINNCGAGFESTKQVSRRGFCYIDKFFLHRLGLYN